MRRIALERSLPRIALAVLLTFSQCPIDSSMTRAESLYGLSVQMPYHTHISQLLPGVATIIACCNEQLRSP
jgi:hypothetical protein